jgi:hypothetical protein
MTLLRRFAPLGAVALVFFFMGIPARIPQKWIPVLRPEYAQLISCGIFFG